MSSSEDYSVQPKAVPSNPSERLVCKVFGELLAEGFPIQTGGQEDEQDRRQMEEIKREILEAAGEDPEQPPQDKYDLGLSYCRGLLQLRFPHILQEDDDQDPSDDPSSEASTLVPEEEDWLPVVAPVLTLSPLDRQETVLTLSPLDRHEVEENSHTIDLHNETELLPATSEVDASDAEVIPGTTEGSGDASEKIPLGRHEECNQKREPSNESEVLPATSDNVVPGTTEGSRDGSEKMEHRSEDSEATERLSQNMDPHFEEPENSQETEQLSEEADSLSEYLEHHWEPPVHYSDSGSSSESEVVAGTSQPNREVLQRNRNVRASDSAQFPRRYRRRSEIPDDLLVEVNDPPEEPRRRHRRRDDDNVQDNNDDVPDWMVDGEVLRPWEGEEVDIWLNSDEEGIEE